MKIWDALFRRARQADNEAANKIDVNDAERGRQVLEDANKQISGFESQVAGLMASRKRKENQIQPLQANIDKYENIAKKAGAANNADDLRQALTEKAKFQGQLDTLKAEIEKDSGLEAKLRKQLRDARDKIARSEAKSDSLKVRQESARIRQAFATNAFDKAGSALSQLNDWESKVEREESLAEAKEDLAGDGNQSAALTEKYQDTSAIDAEMAKYLKA